LQELVGAPREQSAQTLARFSGTPCIESTLCIHYYRRRRTSIGCSYSMTWKRRLQAGVLRTAGCDSDKDGRRPRDRKQADGGDHDVMLRAGQATQ